MGLCGCFPSCACMLNIVNNGLLSLSGNGDTATGGWTLAGIETVFAGFNSDGTILVTPGGSYGHTPSIDTVIDPASTSIVSKSVAGLRIDSVVASVLDTDSVDLTLAGDVLSADVRIDPAGSAPVSVTVDGLKIDCCPSGGAGDLTIADTDTIDMDNAGDILSANVIIDPNSPIPLSSSANGLAAGPMDSVNTTIWRQGALVTVTGTTSLVFAENGAVATYNSAAGYRGITWLNPADYVSAGGTCEARVVLDYATVTAPGVKIGCSLFPVTSVSAGTLTLGGVLATAQTVAAAGADEAGAAVTPWVTIAAASFLVATFEWAAISGAANTYGDMRIEVREQ